MKSLIDHFFKEERRKKSYLPIGDDQDSRDSSLIVYTITVAIAVALFVLTLTLPREFLWSRGLNIFCAILFLSSTILTFYSIELMVDITSFLQSNTINERKRKYKKVLIYYNASIVLIIGAMIALSLNFLFKYLEHLTLKHMFSTIKSRIHFVIIGLVIVYTFVWTWLLTRKWQKDVGWVFRATIIVKDEVPSK